MLTHISVLGLAITLNALAGQEPSVDPAEQAFKLTATAELVLLDVSVKDPEGGHVTGLSRDNFRVYEDGKLQTITQFSRDDVPVSVGLVIDTSGSMRTKHPEVVTSAVAFVQESNRKDEVFVVNFNDRASLGLPASIPFTDNTASLREALALGNAEGRTALYDALVLSLNHLEKGTREKKALVLVSDGGDNASAHRFEDVLRLVRESQATIYTIGIFDEDDKDRNPGMLERLARISGGEAFFPKQVSDVEGICREIAGDIRTRYTVGYVPVRSSAKGSLRKIRAVAAQSGGRKLVTRARTSYILPDRTRAEQYGEPNKKPDL